MTAKTRARRVMRFIGRSIYLIIVQTAVGLAALLLLLYLTVNSPSAARLLSVLLTDILPGSLEVDALQVGPTPGHVRIRGLRIGEPHGSTVIAAAEADIQLDWLRLVDALARGKPQIPLHATRVALRSPEVVIENDRFGRLLLPQAFSDPDKPPTGKPGPNLRIDVDRVIATDVTYRMRLPAVTMKVSGASLRGAVQIQIPPFGSPKVAWQARHVQAAAVDIAPSAMAKLPPIPTASAQVRSAEGDLDGVRVRDADIQVPAMRHWDDLTLPDTVAQGLDLAIALTPDVVVDAHDADIVTSTQSAFMGRLLGKKFDCAAVATGRFRVDPEAGFSTSADVIGWGKIAGFETERVRAAVEVHASVAGQAGVTVDGTQLEVDAYGGHIEAPLVRYRMLDAPVPECWGAPNDACDPPEYRGEPTHLVDGTFTLDHIRAGDVLHSEAVAMDAPWTAHLRGAVTGTVHAGVRVRLEEALDCPLPMVLDVSLDNAWTLAADATHTMGDPEQPTTLPPVLSLTGHVGYTTDEECAARVALGNVLVADRGYNGKHDETQHHEETEQREGDWLWADGDLHLGDDDSRLRVNANIRSLARLLEPLGISGISGALQVTGADVTGGVQNPGLVGRLSGRNLGYTGVIHHQTMALGLDRLDAQVRLRGRVLSLDGVDTCGPITGCIHGDLALDLSGKGEDGHAGQTMQVRNLDVKNLALGKLLGVFGVNTAGIDGVLGLTGARVDVDLARPLTTLAVAGRAVIQNLQVVGQFFPEVRATATAQRGHVHLHPLDIQLVTHEWAHAHVDADLTFQHFDIGLMLPKTPLVSLSPSMAKMPLRGTLGGTASLTGSGGKLAMDVALTADDVAWDKIELQDADLKIQKTLDGPAVMTSAHFFPGFRLLPGSEGHFAGLALQEIVLHLDTPDPLDVFATLGRPSPAGLTARVTGDVVTTIDLRPGATLYTVQATLPPRGLVMDMGSGVAGLMNTSPGNVVVTPGKITLDPVYLDLGREHMTLCGDLTPGKGEDAPMDLHADLVGVIDVPRLGALNDSLAAMDLRLGIFAPKDDPQATLTRCLDPSEGQAGVLRLDGPVTHPVMVGHLRSQAGVVTPRHFGHDVIIEEGAELSLTPALDADGDPIPGGIDLEIAADPVEERLAGTVEDGHFDSYGTARLIDFQPETVNWTFNASGVPFAVPKEYAISLSPQLTFTGTRLTDPARRKMALTGQVDVPDGSYYRNFDTISGVVGNVADRQVEQYSKPLTETMPWLNDIALDLKVNAQNIDVASRIPFARVDAVVETEGLAVTGTLPHMNIVGRARVAPSSDSKITYAINRLVFDVDHLWLDFQGDMMKPFIDADIRAPITVRGQSTSAATSAIGADLNQDNQASSDVILVSVGYSGILTAGAKAEDLRFADNKGDSPADVQCLILTNRKCSDSGSGGAPPISSQALLGDLGPSLLKPFQKLLGIDAVFDQFGFDLEPTGAVGVNASKKLGNQISFSTRVLSGATERRYNVSFNFRATDRLSAGGLWKRAITTDATAPIQNLEVYEFKLKYKQPLE